MLRASAMGAAVLHLTVTLTGEHFPPQSQTEIFWGFKLIYQAVRRG